MIRCPFEATGTTVRRDPPGTVTASNRVGVLGDAAADGVLNTISVPLGVQAHWEMSTASRSEEHTSELQSRLHLVCRLLRWRPPRRPLVPYTPLFRSRIGSR